MTGYNGWSNRATWAAALWLDNDESTRKYAERALYWEDTLDGLEDAAVDMWGILTDGARQDIGNFEDVNWEEVARDAFGWTPTGEPDAATVVASLHGDDVSEWRI